MQKQRGFTLIELLIVLAITAILVMLATPSFKRMTQSSAVSSSVNSFLADLRYARSEAVRRGGNVVMCRSDNPEAAVPACSGGSGPGNKGWVSGWIIFHDLSSPVNGTYDAGTDLLLRVQAATTTPDEITDTPASNKFVFTATGRLSATSVASSMHFGSTAYGTERKLLCVSLGGRGRVAPTGTATCSDV